MAGEVFLHRFPLCILQIYLVPAVWQESSRSVSLIQMYPVSERCRTVVCALYAFFISHPSVQIISYNFYLLLVRNLVFRHKFLPLWKQCFISLSLIEGAYHTGRLHPVHPFNACRLSAVSTLPAPLSSPRSAPSASPHIPRAYAHTHSARAFCRRSTSGSIAPQRGGR